MIFKNFNDFVLLNPLKIIINDFNKINEKKQDLDIDDKYLKKPIAVYTSTYNVEENGRGRGNYITFKKMINDLIDCLNKQTYNNWKLFIVGDAFQPEEELVDILKSKLKPSQYTFKNMSEPGERGKIDPKYLRNSGGIKAKNLSIKLAKDEGFEYFASIDHDDIWKPQHLESMMKAFQQDDEIGFGYHRASRARHKGGGQGNYYWGDDKTKATLFFDDIETKITEAPHSGIFWHGPSVNWPKYRTVPQQKSGAPKRSKIMGGDEDFIRLCIDGLNKNNKKAVYVPKLLVKLRNSVGKLPK